jgi:hypothetical protein
MFMKQELTIKKPVLQNQYVDLIASLLEAMCFWQRLVE